MTSPVFVFILARVWLGDPVDWVDIIAAVVCIAGVFFVSKPSAIFGCDTTDDCSLTQYVYFCFYFSSSSTTSFSFFLFLFAASLPLSSGKKDSNGTAGK